ncbi:hypothetical protein [Kineococcus sp. R86509]|uniref:hypothetical protein n=1 Tax=Kineococcus sp. R86509 TaxID=3093851 RepID=UPI0036D3D816
MSPRGAKSDLAEAGRPQPVRTGRSRGRARPQGIDLDAPAEVEVASGAYRRRMARYRDQMDPGEREQFADTLTVDPDADSTVVVDGRAADLAVAANARRRELPAYPGSVPTQPPAQPPAQPAAKSGVRLMARRTDPESKQEAERKARQQAKQDRPSRRQRRKEAAENRREHRNFGRERRRNGDGASGEVSGQLDGLAILGGTGQDEFVAPRSAGAGQDVSTDIGAELSPQEVLAEQKLSARALRRRDKADRKAAAQAGLAVSGPGVQVLPAPRGYQVRTSQSRARRGGYAPLAAPALSSTRQAQILNTAIVAAPTGVEGIIIGRDKLSNTLVSHDPFTAYENGQIGSPNVVTLGSISAGKSSLLKTVYVLRPLIMKQRRVVVMDKKDRGGEGEYAETGRTFGTEPLRFVVGEGGVRLNILDPMVLAGAGVDGQARLLAAIAELANNNQPLDPRKELPALEAAHLAALRHAELEGRAPYLEDLLPQLGRVDHPDFVDYSVQMKEKMHEAGMGVRALLQRLLSSQLAGLFNGPTSPGVSLSDRLTVFDISQLPEDGPAVSMVTAVSNAWLMGTLRNRRGLLTNYVAEEGWHLVGGPGGRVFRQNSKLARGLGLSNIAAIHHLADVPTDDDAIAMIKEAQTVHLYRQDREDDIAACLTTFSLDAGAAYTLANLETGHHLLKIGNRPEIHVQHVRSALERQLTNTDDAMVTSGKGRGL